MIFAGYKVATNKRAPPYITYYTYKRIPMYEKKTSNSFEFITIFCASAHMRITLSHTTKIKEVGEQEQAAVANILT